MLGNQTGTWCVPVAVALTESSPKEAWLPAAEASNQNKRKVYLQFEQYKHPHFVTL